MGIINYKEAANSSFQNVAAGVSSGLGSALGGLINKVFNPSAYKAAMREHLTGAEREQNAFNAQQAALQRNWQEKMFGLETELENSAYQRQVADMEAAGVNPALMYGGAGASGAGSPSAGSGAAASAAGASPADIQALTQMQMAGAQIGLIRAQTSKVKAETQGQEIDNANKPEYWSKQLALLGANREEALANVARLEQDVKTGAADEALKRANEKLTTSRLTTVDLENAILGYKEGMAKLDAMFYEANKSLDLAIKSATLDKTEEEIKNLRKARALLVAQIITEGAKQEMFRKNAKQSDEFARFLHKKTTWYDSETLEKLRNLGGNTELIDHLARKYDSEADYNELKPLLELVNAFTDLVSEY